jgi:hypothetical protein
MATDVDEALSGPLSKLRLGESSGSFDAKLVSSFNPILENIQEKPRPETLDELVGDLLQHTLDAQQSLSQTTPFKHLFKRAEALC